MARAISAARARALQSFSHGEDLKADEGSLTRLSSKIYLAKLVHEHNRGGEHLDLHQPVCLEHQYKSGVIFGCNSTPMLLLNVPRGINSGWPLLAGFDSTFGITPWPWNQRPHLSPRYVTYASILQDSHHLRLYGCRCA